MSSVPSSSTGAGSIVDCSAPAFVSTDLGMANGRNEAWSRSMTPSYPIAAAAVSVVVPVSVSMSPSTPPLIARRGDVPLPSVPPTAPCGVEGRTARSEATATMLATEIGRRRSGALNVRNPAATLVAIDAEVSAARPWTVS